MRRLVWLSLAVAFFLPAIATAQSNVSTVGPFLNNYCIGCHSQTRKVGGLMLDAIRLDDVSKDAEVWEKMLREMRARTMPPPIASVRPSESDYNMAITTIASALDAADAQKGKSAPAFRISD